MGLSAFVLGVTQIGKEREVLEKCLKIKGVIEGYLVFGEFDILLKLETQDIKELTKRIEEIRKVDGLLRTTTLITMQ
ncbi:MAG: Lrp/AsnC ligand binding domain-containing protein [Candidatus Methanomethylicia archaeon]|jgi:anthranilate phosphoribosyltransferase|uniref:Lrp/AsnC family transcriptional regulator n=1 Tax=Thermoproteota archaeon TaxID=2056631 RepID=A0A520KFQ8_9CREN|nr:Lrp/AsnC ligand binding domain-containing protein [Candidatus Methanomethylicia archaeon]MCQ5340192.1 Lrp/AsnC ligand binding domain-containing protein [Candidatus Methanomethylicia archaeon]NHV45588.1 Lrp/AsnC family transcriptional regulator [Candidatus Verstraetearchaeota archaeon]RZN56381.1 MAG: Lrp/AsnC family transcriptional regulator [Candidatus Verstraetearchaeota archaeon]TDA40041.1 MAG: Lrp/AsnC family transcriptional regulator [Candidatus Verstraetearchaeota archaeon]